MRTEASWSLLTPKPIVLYSKKLDKHIVYWYGVGMSHGEALLLAGITMGIYPSPKMKAETYYEFETIYLSNGFKTRSWDKLSCMDPYAHLGYLSRIVYDARAGGNYPKISGPEILSMLDKRTAIVVED